MVIIGLKRLMVSLILITVLSLAVIVIGLSLNTGKPWQLKLDYQNFFFWGLTAVIIQIIVGASIIVRHRRIIGTIKRLSAIEDLESVYAGKLFDELGVLGAEIRNVLRHGNQLSVLRAARISALNNLAEILCEGYSDLILITDVSGSILSMSDKLHSRFEKEGQKGGLENILQVRPDIKLSEVLVFMEKQHASWSQSDASGLSCTPVFDKNNTVQFCLWEFETSIFTGKLKDNARQGYDLRRSYGRLKGLLNPGALRSRLAGRKNGGEGEGEGEDEA